MLCGGVRLRVPGWSARASCNSTPQPARHLSAPPLQGRSASCSVAGGPSCPLIITIIIQQRNELVCQRGRQPHLSIRPHKALRQHLRCACAARTAAVCALPPLPRAPPPHPPRTHTRTTAVLHYPHAPASSSRPHRTRPPRPHQPAPPPCCNNMNMRTRYLHSFAICAHAPASSAPPHRSRPPRPHRPPPPTRPRRGTPQGTYRTHPHYGIKPMIYGIKQLSARLEAPMGPQVASLPIPQYLARAAIARIRHGGCAAEGQARTLQLSGHAREGRLEAAPGGGEHEARACVCACVGLCAGCACVRASMRACVRVCVHAPVACTMRFSWSMHGATNRRPSSPEVYSAECKQVQACV